MKLKSALDKLMIERPIKGDLARDPIRFVHRYQIDDDIEIAGIFASALAYGRVDLFGPVINALLNEADHWGGPRCWIKGFGRVHADRISHLKYRWNRAPDFALLALALKGAIAEYGSLATLFETGTALLTDGEDRMTSERSEDRPT